MINIPPDLCENISLTVLIGNNVNSCTVSICVYMHILFTKGHWSGKEINKIETALNAACNFGHACQMFIGPGLTL